jgi:hypothetical protein
MPPFWANYGQQDNEFSTNMYGNNNNNVMLLTISENSTIELEANPQPAALQSKKESSN